MIATLRPLTYDDLLNMPDDGQRREVLAGELLVNPAPQRDHQEVAANLDWILQRFLRSSGLGRIYTHPVDVFLGRNDIVQPDTGGWLVSGVFPALRLDPAEVFVGLS